MLRTRYNAACLLLLALAYPGLAGVVITGRVSDENDVAVPGARVEFRGREHPPVVELADALGQFQVTLPEPGDWRVRVTQEGFFVFEGPVEAREGVVLSITIHHLRDFFQNVDVTYSPPVIDPEATAEKKQLTNIQILEVPYPASQDVRNAMPMFQGVVQDTQGKLHFNGGATGQTNFTLDGFNVSDPVTGLFDARVNIETVRTIDYEGTRFSAEKGRGSAGTVDLKTTMGDDRWRFGATNFVPGASNQNGLHLNKWTPRLQVSGPLARGRAWFSNGFDAFYDIDTIPDLPDGANRSRALSSSNLTWAQVNLSAANILTTGFLYNYGGDRRFGLTVLDPAETTLNRRRTYQLATIKDQHYFHRGIILETGFADSRWLVRESPQGRETFEISPSGRRGNYFVDLTRHTRRQEWMAKGFFPAISGLGTHQVTAGLNVQRSSFRQYAERHEYRVLRRDNSLARAVNFFGDGRPSRANFEFTEYVQDRWEPLPGLLVEGGLRIDWDQVVRDVMLSPRLSSAWAPRWMGGARISTGIGVFYDAINLETVSRHLDQTAVATFFAPDGAISRGPISTQFLVDDRDLRLPRYRIFSLSLDRPIAAGIVGRATYIRRTGARGFGFFSDFDPVGLDETPFQLRNWRNDRYDSLEFGARQTFGGRFQWFAGYTYSQARTDAVVDFSLENPIFARQSPGRLAWDTPHRYLTWGWAPMPKKPGSGLIPWLTRDTTVAYLIEARTGFPFHVVNEEGFLVGAPHSRRYPRYFNVNLHFERRFPFLHYMWAWRFGINNLTNSGNPNVVNNNIDSPDFLAFGRGQQRAVNVRLRFLGRR
ncbi:MAG: TonB-dependent receptor [Bryobacterales bacterium]|nr:TonB-dependent receptor [Bryobacterales bacterium]